MKSSDLADAFLLLQLQAEDQTSCFDCFDVQQLETEFRVSQALALTIMATTGYSQKTGP